MPLDLDFFDDPGVQLLYEENAADVADAAVVLFIKMLIRAHRLDSPDVLEEFQRSKSERRHQTLATLANAGLLGERGIKPESFRLWRTPDRGHYDSDRGRAGGIARAQTAERENGRFAPASASVDQRTTSVDQRYQPGTVRYGTGSESENDSTTNGEVYDERFVALSSLMTDLTGRAYALANPFGGMAQKALELIDRHGWETFESRARLVAERIGKNPGVDEIVFGVGNSLRRGVETADVKRDERQAEIEDDQRRRLDRTQLQMHFQHTEPSEHPTCPACRGEVAV